MDTELTIGHEQVTYALALEQESDVLCRIGDANKDQEMRQRLEAHGSQITQLVGHHLDIPSHYCQVAGIDSWLDGRTNLCIPVSVKRPAEPDAAVAFRCPKSHRIKTTLDEKMRAEIGTQVWIEEHCPNINTPDLMGFRLNNGLQVVTREQAPLSKTASD